MYEVEVWNDVQGDFIIHQKDGKRFITDDYDLAAEIAADFIADGVQAKVSYVRQQFVNPQRKKKPRAGRIKRIVKAHEIRITEGTENDAVLHCANCSAVIDVDLETGILVHQR